MFLSNRAWINLLLLLIPTSSSVSVALANNQYSTNGILGRIQHGGAQVMKDPSSKGVGDGSISSTKLYSSAEVEQSSKFSSGVDVSQKFSREKMNLISNLEKNSHHVY